MRFLILPVIIKKIAMLMEVWVLACSSRVRNTSSSHSLTDHAGDHKPMLSLAQRAGGILMVMVNHDSDYYHGDVSVRNASGEQIVNRRTVLCRLCRSPPIHPDSGVNTPTARAKMSDATEGKERVLVIW